MAAIAAKTNANKNDAGEIDEAADAVPVGIGDPPPAVDEATVAFPAAALPVDDAIIAPLEPAAEVAVDEEAWATTQATKQAKMAIFE